MTNVPKFMRREQAAQYLTARWGFGTKASLSKWACVGGGPRFRKIGRFPLYEAQHLDEWALERLGGLQSSTSDVVNASKRDVTIVALQAAE